MWDCSGCQLVKGYHHHLEECWITGPPDTTPEKVTRRELRRVHQKMQTVTEADAALALNLPHQETATGLGTPSSPPIPGPPTKPSE